MIGFVCRYLKFLCIVYLVIDIVVLCEVVQHSIYTLIGVSFKLHKNCRLLPHLASV
jgi:hypothetical protein